jgi:hypothetical protein
LWKEVIFVAVLACAEKYREKGEYEQVEHEDEEDTSIRDCFRKRTDLGAVVLQSAKTHERKKNRRRRKKHAKRSAFWACGSMNQKSNGKDISLHETGI